MRIVLWPFSTMPFFFCFRAARRCVNILKVLIDRWHIANFGAGFPLGSTVRANSERVAFLVQRSERELCQVTCFGRQRRRVLGDGSGVRLSRQVFGNGSNS